MWTIAPDPAVLAEFSGRSARLHHGRGGLRSQWHRHIPQIGAQIGYGLSWTIVPSFPLMVTIQEVAAEIGRVTGLGMILRRHALSRLAKNMAG